MQLKTAVKLYLESKEELTSYATYKSCSQYLEVTINLKTIDLAGDLLTSERKRRIKKTKELFKKVEHNLRKKSQNTKFFTINMLKSILIMVEEEDGSRFWKSYEVKQELKDVVILDVKFAKDFINDPMEVYDSLSQKLRTVWEISAVMLTTCLRLSDAINLTADSIKDNKIMTKNQKTGVVTACPIPDSLYYKLTENQKKYGRIYSEELSKDTCYRQLSNLLNKYPEMCTMVNGEFLFDIFKFHIFRKTAISVMLAFGVPESIVKRASGHAVNSKAFARYVGHVETMFDEKINNFQSKFYSS